MPCCSSVSMTSSPASTPRLPSKRPPVRHGVDVRARHHRRRRRVGAGPGGDDVADGVDGDVEPEVAHPADDEVAALAGRRRSAPGGRSPARRPGPRWPRSRRAPRCRAHRRSPSTRRSARPRSRARGRCSKAAISHEGGAERVDGAGEQLGAPLGGGRDRVADDAVVAEVVGQPAERHRRRRSARSGCRRGARGPGGRRRSCRRAPARGGASSTSRRCRRGCPCPAPRPATTRPGRRASPGWARNVISPWCRRSSRLATLSSALLPPCPLRNTSRRAGVIATQRPRSSSTASSVVGDSQIVPGDQACSLDLV